MIQLKEAKKIYKNGRTEYPALNGIDLTIENGEYVAIIGTSGSGKSTLLNIIGGMDQTTDGQYLYDEKNVSKMNSHALHLFRKEYVSFVFQRFALLNQYSVYENVEVPLLAKGIEKKERKKKVLSALMQVGIQDLYKKKPSELSGGEQQRCAIARALVMDTPVVLADEPTGSLDKNSGTNISSLSFFSQPESNITIPPINNKYFLILFCISNNLSILNLYYTISMFCYIHIMCYNYQGLSLLMQSF